MGLPGSLKSERRGDVGVLVVDGFSASGLLDQDTVVGIEKYFADLKHGIRAAVLALGSSTRRTSAQQDTARQRFGYWESWRRALQNIQYGDVPVVAALRGVVRGSGLELAAAAQLRVAERSASYLLPQQSLATYVRCGAVVRLPQLFGVSRLLDMMLTGRIHSAEEAHAMGFSNYLVDDGQGLLKALEVAEVIAQRATIECVN